MTYEAAGGMMLIPAGKKRNGKPHVVLALQAIVCFTAADAKAVEKANPGLKFVERGEPAAGQGGPVRLQNEGGP